MKKSRIPPTSNPNGSMSDSPQLDVSTDAGAEYAATILLWVLRILGPLRGYTRLDHMYTLDQEEILENCMHWRNKSPFSL